MSSCLEDLCAFALLCRLMQVAEHGSSNVVRDILVKLPTCLINKICETLNASCHFYALNVYHAFDIEWCAYSIIDTRNPDNLIMANHLNSSLDGLSMKSVIRYCSHLTVEKMKVYLAPLPTDVLLLLRRICRYPSWQSAVREVISSRH